MDWIRNEELQTENVICLADEVRKAGLRRFGRGEKDIEQCGWLIVAGRRPGGNVWMW